MPVKSLSQWRLFKAICEGNLPDGHKGISKDTACSFVRETKEGNLKKLAEHVKEK